MLGAKNNWWRKIARKVSTWLTSLNTVAFGTTLIGTIIKFLLTWNKANNPEWYGITHEHAEEIKPCLIEYMHKASWGEALSTLSLDDWWSWEIVGWACAVCLPTLIIVTVSEKYDAYQKVRKMLYESVKERKTCQLESDTVENLTSSLEGVFSQTFKNIDEYQRAIGSQVKLTNEQNIKTSMHNINYFAEESITLINQGKQQIPGIIDEAIEQLPDEENNDLPPLDEIQNIISAKTVWRNSYKSILLTITPQTGLNFSFLFFALYELIIGNHYAKKYMLIVPVIFNQLKHDYRFLDHACLDVMSRAMATEKSYNTNAKLVSLLVPAIIILGVGIYVVLPKFTKWIRRSDNEEETRLIEGTETTYGTGRHRQYPVELPNILPQDQVLI